MTINSIYTIILEWMNEYEADTDKLKPSETSLVARVSLGSPHQGLGDKQL